MLLINFVSDFKAHVAQSYGINLAYVNCGQTAYNEVCSELRSFNFNSIRTNKGMNAMFNGITMDFVLNYVQINPLITFNFGPIIEITLDCNDILNDAISVPTAALRLGLSSPTAPKPPPPPQPTVNPHFYMTMPPVSGVHYNLASSFEEMLSKETMTKNGHNCEMKQYIGFTESYRYCTICDKKVYDT